MTENFPELGKEISVHMQEACGTPTDRAGKEPLSPTITDTLNTHSRTYSAGSKEGTA